MGLTTGWEPATSIDDTLLRRFVYAFASRLEAMADARGGRRQRTDAAAFADPGSAFVFDNAVTLLQPPIGDAIDEVVDTGSRFFPDESTWVLVSPWPTPDLSGHGLELVGHPPFMARLGPPPRAPAPPPALRVHEVTAASNLEDFDRVLVEGYPMPPAGAIVDPRLLGGQVRLWTGYEEQPGGGARPVAVSGANVAHGVVEVEWVAVLPEARGRGYGRAITEVAASCAPGLPAVLLASDDGRPVYERMGFVALQRFTLWWRPAPTLSP